MLSCHAFSSHLVSCQPTESGWCHIDFVSCNFIILSSCMNNNRMWVTLQWTSTSTRRSHHISFHDQQDVSETAVVSCHSSSAHFIPWPTGSESYYCYFLPDSFITSHQPINQQIVSGTAAIFHHAVSSYLISCPIACESHCNYFCKIVSSHLIPCTTGCEWHYNNFLSQNLSTWETVCEWHCSDFDVRNLQYRILLLDKQMVGITAAIIYQVF